MLLCVLIRPWLFLSLLYQGYSSSFFSNLSSGCHLLLLRLLAGQGTFPQKKSKHVSIMNVIFQEQIKCMHPPTPKYKRYYLFILPSWSMTQVRGVKLIFTGDHISLAIAFKGPSVILGLYKCNCSLTRGKELPAASGQKQGGGPDSARRPCVCHL